MHRCGLRYKNGKVLPGMQPEEAAPSAVATHMPPTRAHVVHPNRSDTTTPLASIIARPSAAAAAFLQAPGPPPAHMRMLGPDMQNGLLQRGGTGFEGEPLAASNDSGGSEGLRAIDPSELGVEACDMEWRQQHEATFDGINNTEGDHIRGKDVVGVEPMRSSDSLAHKLPRKRDYVGSYDASLPEHGDLMPYEAPRKRRSKKTKVVDTADQAANALLELNAG